MSAKNAKRLEAINQKITSLQKIKSQIESDFVDGFSKDVSKLLVKKGVFNIDKSVLIKKIESFIG